MSRVRRKRASVTDLYKSCALGADCLPDVKNKVEGNTLADILLKVFGSIIYLGNLGIGTGRGSGGQYGYTPFGGSRPSSTITPARPSLPVDTVVPGEVFPITPIESSIVPLSEGLPDPAVIDIPGAGPGLNETVDVTTVLDPVSEVTGIGEHPAVIYNTDQVAQLDVQLQPPPPKRILLDANIHNTETDILTHASHVDADYNVFVDAQLHGDHIGPPISEEIELQEINLREEFEIDEGPKRSTPLSSRAISRARDLYHRFVEQVPTREVLNQSGFEQVYEFDNPAFDADVADEFDREVQRIADEAQNKQLQDVIALSDIRFGETPQGTVRVSRLGQRAGMITRSGLQIGKRVHLYYDISPIQSEAIELRTFGEYSHEATVVDELTSTAFINPFENPIEGELEFSEDTLVDNLEEEFAGTHVVLSTTTEDGDTFDTPTIPPGIGVRVFVDDYGKSLIVSNTIANDSSIFIPESPSLPIGPAAGIDVILNDYDLHPSLLPRKRKRSSF
ncbi:L2 [Gammapapillomavirus 9]|uniref:Minor capsid protein L2 n=2 Tax=Papillomaviridae TaxID=151340 RepID=A0A386ATK3_9PAPI|nr:L2 [Gammapapillomavirus 9]AYC54514.1 MAG: L2 protein [Human papillomavirus]